jgi:hypothetical protein
MPLALPSGALPEGLNLRIGRGGAAMLTTGLPYRLSSEGQIALERALFCLECELIFAGTAHCPRCADKAVWPLAEWLHRGRPAITVSKWQDGPGESLS